MSGRGNRAALLGARNSSRMSRDFSAEMQSAATRTGVLLVDDERGLHTGYEHKLEELASHEHISRYRDKLTGKDDGDAHPRRQVMGCEVVVAVTSGRPDFGPRQQILCGEFDRRRKRVLVKIIGK